MEKPIPIKMSLRSSSTMVSGCFFPIHGRFPGMVTSMVSFAIFSAAAAVSSAVFLSSSADSIKLRTSLAIWPMIGRSSGESFPIPFITAVSSPFLPKYFTRRVSSSARSLAVDNAVAAADCIAFSCSFICFAS